MSNLSTSSSKKSVTGRKLYWALHFITIPKWHGAKFQVFKWLKVGDFIARKFRSTTMPSIKAVLVFTDFSKSVADFFVQVRFKYTFKYTRYSLHVATEQHAPSLYFYFPIKCKADKKSVTDFQKSMKRSATKDIQKNKSINLLA